MARIIAAATALVLLAGCGGGIGSSSLNPFNWFRGGEEARETFVPPTAQQDSRPLVEEVTDIVVERVPGGAILRARGRVAATGWFAADLVAEPERSGAGVLAFTFRAVPPPVPAGVTGSASRLVVAGVYLSDEDLFGIGQIQVAAQTNIRTARR